MAAHSVTILVEAANVHNWSETKREMYTHACDYAPGMGEVDPVTWGQLRDLLVRGEYDKLIRDTILVILHDQIDRWIELGYPETHGEWVEAATRGED